MHLISLTTFVHLISQKNDTRFIHVTNTIIWKFCSSNQTMYSFTSASSIFSKMHLHLLPSLDAFLCCHVFIYNKSSRMDIFSYAYAKWFLFFINQEWDGRICKNLLVDQEISKANAIKLPWCQICPMPKQVFRKCFLWVLNRHHQQCLRGGGKGELVIQY